MQINDWTSMQMQQTFALNNENNAECRKGNKKPTNWLDQAKRRATKIQPKAIGGPIFGRFSNFDKCRPGVGGDIVPGLSMR